MDILRVYFTASVDKEQIIEEEQQYGKNLRISAIFRVL